MLDTLGRRLKKKKGGGCALGGVDWEGGRWGLGVRGFALDPQLVDHWFPASRLYARRPRWVVVVVVVLFVVVVVVVWVSRHRRLITSDRWSVISQHNRRPFYAPDFFFFSLLRLPSAGLSFLGSQSSDRPVGFTTCPLLRPTNLPTDRPIDRPEKEKKKLLHLMVSAGQQKKNRRGPCKSVPHRSYVSNVSGIVTAAAARRKPSA